MSSTAEVLLYAVDSDGYVYFAPETRANETLYYHQIAGWLPDNVVARFGQPFDTMTASGVTFDPDDLPAIVAALEELGVHCREHSNLPECFSAFD